MSAVEQKPPSPDELREEARLEESLEQLKELHIKLRGLRTLVPRMVESLSAPHPSPEAFFTAFRKSVMDANNDVSQFRAAMTSKESKAVFDEANASRQTTPQGIRPWRATDDPNWTTPRKKKP